MRRLNHAIAATVLTLGLAACGGPADSGSSSSSSGGASPAAEATPTGPSLASAPPEFAQCVACHTVKPGVHAVGPSLFGVYGKKAAAVEGYAYSDGLKASGKTWDDATLDKWLTAPAQDVPGTKMTFAGIADPAKRKAIIEFLKTAK